MRMGMRRFTRLTNAFSLDKHCAMLGCIITPTTMYGSVRTQQRITPAIIATRPATYKDLVALIDARAPKQRTYQKRADTSNA